MNTLHIKLYNLEYYITTDVRDNYLKNGHLSTFDFFCIIIWKANRAKSKVANQLLKQNPSLESVVRELSSKLFLTSDDKEKLRILLMDYKFRLPIASALLSTLYPDKFTVYDIRVCDTFPEFRGIENLSFEKLWNSYDNYIQKVRQYGPAEMSLWNKDKLLWGKSFYEQLLKDISSNFNKQTP